MDIRFGTVVHYNVEKGFGFIVPERSRPDGKNVFFHLNNLSELQENEFRHELEFELDRSLWEVKEPRRGDRVCFWMAERPKGPVAYVWNYEEVWRELHKVIESRSEPDNPQVRVMRRDNLRDEAAFEGSLEELLERGKMDSSFPREDPNVYYEQELAHGWERMFSPFEACTDFGGRSA